MKYTYYRTTAHGLKVAPLICRPGVTVRTRGKCRKGAMVEHYEHGKWTNYTESKVINVADFHMCYKEISREEAFLALL